MSSPPSTRQRVVLLDDNPKAVGLVLDADVRRHGQLSLQLGHSRDHGHELAVTAKFHCARCC